MIQYRPEIDGLRALAILPVLFFHAGYTWIPGGFLGVDVFFVISGYLITSILIKEHTENKFSFASFYERRARRILPALFFVLISSSMVAWFVLSPTALVDYAKSTIAVVGFAANVYFWSTISYFDLDTAYKPLLHIWSLGIEEQFYFILPWLLYLGWRRPSYLWIGCGLLAISSLVLNQYLITHSASAAFYLLPSRAWELLVGVFSAYFLHKKQAPFHQKTKQIGSALGLLLLVACFLLFNSDLPHPSAYTLLPVLGTALIIICAQKNTWVAHILGKKIWVWIGLLSYSAYLWHQPLFAFTRIVRLEKELPTLISLSLILLTFVFSYLSWRWIEQPFRNRQFLSQRKIFGLSLTAIFVMIAIASVVWYKSGFPARFDQSAQRILVYENYNYAPIYAEGTCFLTEHQQASDFDPACFNNAAQPNLIWGDSHAAALSYGLKQKHPLWTHLTASGCPPLVQTTISWRPQCEAVNLRILQAIEESQPAMVLLHANWKIYELEDLPERIQKTISTLQKISPKSQLVIVGDIPQWEPSLLDQLRQEPQRFAPESYLANLHLPVTDHLDQQLQHLTAGTPFISLRNLLCKEDKCLVTVGTNIEELAPLNWDYGHLTAEGSIYLANQLGSTYPYLINTPTPKTTN